MGHRMPMLPVSPAKRTFDERPYDGNDQRRQHVCDSDMLVRMDEIPSNAEDQQIADIGKVAHRLRREDRREETGILPKNATRLLPLQTFQYSSSCLVPAATALSISG